MSHHNITLSKRSITLCLFFISLAVHFAGFLFPWYNLSSVKVQDGLAFIGGELWVIPTACFCFEVYFALVKWNNRLSTALCRVLSVFAVIGAAAFELISVIKGGVSASTMGYGLVISAAALALNIICCALLSVSDIKETIQKVQNAKFF